MIKKTICFTLLFAMTAFSMENNPNDDQLRVPTQICGIPNVVWREKIFKQLPLKGLGKAAQVCKAFKEHANKSKDDLLRNTSVKVDLNINTLELPSNEIDSRTPVHLNITGDWYEPHKVDLSPCLTIKNQIVALTFINLKDNVEQLLEIIGHFPHLREIYIEDDLNESKLQILVNNIKNRDKIEVFHIRYNNDNLPSLLKGMTRIRDIKCAPLDLAKFIEISYLDICSNNLENCVEKNKQSFFSQFPKLEILRLSYLGESFDSYLLVLKDHPTLKKLIIENKKMTIGLLLLLENINLKKELALKSGEKYNGLEIEFDK